MPLERPEGVTAVIVRTYKELKHCGGCWIYCKICFLIYFRIHFLINFLILFAALTVIDLVGFSLFLLFLFLFSLACINRSNSIEIILNLVFPYTTIPMQLAKIYFQQITHVQAQILYMRTVPQITT